MEATYGAFPGHEFALSTRKSSNFALFDSYVARELALATADTELVRHGHMQQVASANPSRTSPSKAAALRMTHKKFLERTLPRQQQTPQDRLDEIRWTMAAIRRRKCGHLTKFVTLVAFLQLDVYVSIVLASVDVLYNHLLRGANAAYIGRLTDHDDLVLAFHRTLDVARNHISSNGQSQDGGALESAGGRATSAMPARSTRSFDKRPPLSLTKQQVKRFLRLALDRKFHVVSSGEASSADDAKSAAVWMESKFDALFLQFLTTHTTDAHQSETFTLDDLLQVVERDVAEMLVLPQFIGADHCVFGKRVLEAPNDRAVDGAFEQKGVTKSSSTASAAIENELRSIAILAPVPLVTVTLELVRCPDDPHAYAIAFRPDLADVASVVKSVLSDVVARFDDIPPLTAHPDLLAILRFATDTRSALLEINSDGQGDVESGGGACIPIDNNSSHGGDDDDDSDGRPLSNAERLDERINDSDRYSVLRSLINELLTSMTDAAAQLVACYSSMVAQHAQNEQIDFDDIAARFRRDEYSLQAMTADVTRLNTQVREADES